MPAFPSLGALSQTPQPRLVLPPKKVDESWSSSSPILQKSKPRWWHCWEVGKKVPPIGTVSSSSPPASSTRHDDASSALPQVPPVPRKACPSCDNSPCSGCCHLPLIVSMASPKIGASFGFFFLIKFFSGFHYRWMFIHCF